MWKKLVFLFLFCFLVRILFIVFSSLSFNSCIETKFSPELPFTENGTKRCACMRSCLCIFMILSVDAISQTASGNSRFNQISVPIQIRYYLHNTEMSFFHRLLYLWHTLIFFSSVVPHDEHTQHSNQMPSSGWLWFFFSIRCVSFSQYLLKTILPCKNTVSNLDSRFVILLFLNRIKSHKLICSLDINIEQHIQSSSQHVFKTLVKIFPTLVFLIYCLVFIWFDQFHANDLTVFEKGPLFRPLLFPVVNHHIHQLWPIPIVRILSCVKFQFHKPEQKSLEHRIKLGDFRIA